uniref:unspecific monooxygenase n=1 Tax=Pogona vitticeps TaxID=103695 RepID=A0ABM5FCE1_9SAUR
MEPLGTVTLFLGVCLSCLLLLATVRSRMQGKGRRPPGPTPLPLLGNILQLKTSFLSKALEQLSEKYGPVFTVHFGQLPVVVLHGYDVMKEALIDRADEFAPRGRLPLSDKLNKGEGIIASNGERWKVLRRFALTTLRNFGMGKKSIEERIQEEAQYLREKFQDTKGKPFDPTFLLSCATSNIICSIVFGAHFDYDDERFLALLNTFNDNFKIFSSPWVQMANLFPSLMDLIPGPHQRIIKNNEKLKEFVSKAVKEHKETLDLSATRDFIDCFLIRMEQEKKNGVSEFTPENLVASVLDLFAAGTETTSTTIRYGLLILQKYPEIEEKVHEEIDRVVGRARVPCIADRGQMPYTDAVIHEIQRFISLVPLSAPHSVAKDTPFRQYVIPKGTVIFPALNSALYNSKEFPNPTEFDPQHFLNKDGTFRKSDHFMPFSAGKRICAGEGLARMELFLFLASILQHFKLKPLKDPKEIDISPLMSGTVTFPRPYQLCVLPR